MIFLLSSLLPPSHVSGPYCLSSWLLQLSSCLHTPLLPSFQHIAHLYTRLQWLPTNSWVKHQFLSLLMQCWPQPRSVYLTLSLTPFFMLPFLQPVEAINFAPSISSDFHIPDCPFWPRNEWVIFASWNPTQTLRPNCYEKLF